MNPIHIYRVARWFRDRGLTPVASILDALSFLLFNCVLPSAATIGSGTSLEHRGLGVVLNRRAVIGRDCVISPQVTLGGKGGGVPGAPVVGDNVTIGVGAKLLGPIHVGEGARIGANAVVLTDVPPGRVAVGVPARVR